MLALQPQAYDDAQLWRDFCGVEASVLPWIESQPDVLASAEANRPLGDGSPVC